jgi:hypothetical protein
MEKNNCLRCNFRHKDNGNCTAVGGFCTAVPGAHCPLLRQYLDTGLTPEEIDMDHEAAETLRQLCRGCDLDRLEKLAEADKDRQLVVHGRWVTHYRSGTPAAEGYVSTCCDMWNKRKSPYCPNCGVKMDGRNS